MLPWLANKAGVGYRYVVGTILTIVVGLFFILIGCLIALLRGASLADRWLNETTESFDFMWYVVTKNKEGRRDIP